MRDLFKKYDINGPRYTSYPPVPFWEKTPSENEWFSHLEKNFQKNNEVDLYVHIPYCHELCWYCGCNRQIDKSHKKEAGYLELLLKEWKLYQTKYPGMKINSIHLGGGTPNYLSPESLDTLLSKLLKSKTNSFSGSIEIDPRVCESSHMKTIQKHGITRVSLGIQDFELDVQKAINRVQPFALVSNIVNALRDHGMTEVNFDLIYGLPHQTKETIEKTIKRSLEIGVDSIALYSYAHVPWKAKNQKLIKEEDLLQGLDKLDLFLAAKDLLIKSGMVSIGMDHFAKKDSSLNLAKNENRLKRNFMGYTVNKAPTLLGLGASAISFSGESFIQNEKNVMGYGLKINNGQLPIETGHTMTGRDKEIDELIQQIMCNENWQSPTDVAPDMLNQMESDGLISRNNGRYHVEDIGRPFLRNMAMLYDYRLIQKKTQARFSRTI